MNEPELKLINAQAISRAGRIGEYQVRNRLAYHRVEADAVLVGKIGRVLLYREDRLQSLVQIARIPTPRERGARGGR